jgi:hypothetical protein
MRLSSVIFFSFNSEMVIVTYGWEAVGGLPGRKLAVYSGSGFEGWEGPEQGRAKLRGAAGAEMFPE